MDYTGLIFQATQTVIAQLTATLTGPVTIIEITVGGAMVITFPMPATSDSNEIALRSQNVINQTGLAPADCSVTVQEAT